MKNFIDLNTWLNESNNIVGNISYPVLMITDKDDVDIKEQSPEIRFAYFLILYTIHSTPQFKTSIDIKKAHIFLLKKNDPILYLNSVFSDEIFFDNFNEYTGTEFEKDGNGEYILTLSKYKAKTIAKQLDTISNDFYIQQLNLLKKDFQKEITIKFEKFTYNANIKGLKIRND